MAFNGTYVTDPNVDPMKVAQDILAGDKGQEQQGKPWEVEVRGRKLVINSPEELAGMLDKTFTDFETMLSAAAQNKAAAEAAAAQAQAQQGRYVTGDEQADKFDQTEYYRLLEKDPIKANQYINKHTYGVEDPGAVIKQLSTDLDEHKKVMAIYQFREGHPEYVGGPHNRDVMEKVMERLGLDFTPEGLSAAWAFAKEKGLAQIPQLPQFQQGQGQQFAPPNGQMGGHQPPQPRGNYAPPNPYAHMGAGGAQYPGFAPQPTAPPNLGRGGYEPTPDIQAMAEQMSPEQLEQYIKRLEGNPQR